MSVLALRFFLISLYLFYAAECAPNHTPISESDLLLNFQLSALDEVNQIRSKYKLNPLTLDDELSKGAQEWAESEAKTSRLYSSCNPCDGFYELLTEKRTTGEPPHGQDAAKWALSRWFASLLRSGETSRSTYDTYAALIKDPKIAVMGIGIDYGQTQNGEKTAFAVGRFSASKGKKKSWWKFWP